MIVIKPKELTAWMFPEDAEAGKDAFLSHWDHPQETWVRAYAFTMRELADAIVTANKIAPQHLYIDRSQCEDANQLVLVREVIAAGVETTIGTSPAGEAFIAHTKAYVAADGSCWEGSCNFSESGWHQVNTAFEFLCPEWRDVMVAQFEADVQYAWSRERAYQLMAKPPSSFKPVSVAKEWSVGDSTEWSSK